MFLYHLFVISLYRLPGAGAPAEAFLLLRHPPPRTAYQNPRREGPLLPFQHFRNLNREKNINIL